MKIDRSLPAVDYFIKVLTKRNPIAQGVFISCPGQLTVDLFYKIFIGNLFYF